MHAMSTTPGNRNPAVSRVVRWFAFGHLPAGPIRETSARCADLVDEILETLPDSPELTVGLRKLLEAKDAFVRCAVAARDDR